ncbi:MULTISPECIES: HD domain-containing phosphohydrolase [unclassified Oceanispirochaeta]|nr:MULTISPECIES: HD domain-containing phosphohydrolase [unclassified Oceanispirochaeta]MBF9018226.1 GAF domain-containing protein [Oceanispirochaeta sp. M2]NPD74668.1 GAF domain-containing protein [Oceanispirochaeta sp. M1]RDG29462.1 GAF domain-containing protein [Oceanispirochaeta sp. M1]
MMSKVSRKFNTLLILSVALSVFFSSMTVTVYLLFRAEKDTHEKNLIHLQGLAENIRAFLDHGVTLNYQLSINPEIKDSILEAEEDWDTRRENYSRNYNTDTAVQDLFGTPLLSMLQQQYDFVELFFVQDKQGFQTARSFGALGQRTDRWWFKKMAVNQDYRSFLSHSYYSLTGGKPVASIFHPIMDEGQFIGIMGMDINFDKLQEIVESYMVLEDIYAIVTDMEGVVIAHPDSQYSSEIYNLKDMTRSVLKDQDSSLNVGGYRDLEVSDINWPEEMREAVLRGISGEKGFYENVIFPEGAQNVYFAPIALSGTVNMNSNYVVFLVHDRSPILRTRNTIFIYILIFILSIILILYYIFKGRFNQNIIAPLEVLIDSMKDLDFEHFEEIDLITDDEFSLLSSSYNRLRRKLADANNELKNKVDFLKESEGGYKAFADIGLALSTEKNVDKLMELILDEARKLTRADGGTLYLYNEEDDCLEFSILHNETMGSRLGGTSGNPVTLPPVPLSKEDGTPNKSNASSHAAITGEIINIHDVYKAENFDFSGTQTYDRLNNYHSKSMLVIPMKNMSGLLIGVIQLINARERDTPRVQPFSEFSETLIVSLASQAAVALTNVELNKDLEELFHAFMRSIATAVDEKSAFTGGHITRVVILTMLIAEGMNRDDSTAFAGKTFNQEEMEELKMAAWMHDIGKVTTPESVMDKKTKLEGMQDRIELIESRYRMICGSIKTADDNCDHEQMKEEMEFLRQCNLSGEFLSDDKLERLKTISKKTYVAEGQEYPYITENELYNLSIRKGNLTPEERKQIEHHAAMTRNILAELKFPGHLSMVGDYASMHHEKLDGSGYPEGLKGEDIPLQARIISVADIFEALTAKDRPYRQPMKLSKALSIMDFMIKDGHIDADVFTSFKSSGAMKRYADEELNPEQVDLELPDSAE